MSSNQSSHLPRAQAGSGASDSSSTGGGGQVTAKGGLRSRKLSLTTRQIPLSTGSQISPSATSEPSPKAGTTPLSEIGLGLMLDEANAAGRNSSSSEGRASVETGGGGGGRGNPTTARVGDEAEEFFLAATATSASGGSNGGNERRNSSGRLPQLSTITTSSGATPSPLQIFTGSPSPSFTSNSPLPSPIPTSRPYSPNQYAHQAYNLGSSSSSSSQPNSSASASHPMSRPPSYNTIMSSSQPMDRSRSNGSDIHARQQSLTSACPPATSSVINGYSTPKSDITAFSPASSNGPRSWRTYDWGMPSEKGSSSDEDVREGGKSRGEPGVGSKILAIPNAILAIFLAPLNSGSHSRQPYSPNLNGSSSPSKPSTSSSGSTSSTRYPLIVRLLTISYLVFSFSFLSIKLSSHLLSDSSSDALRAKLESRGGQEGWQLMRQYADGLGAKAGIDLSWAHYKSSDVGDGAVDEDDWGMIRRIGHPDGESSNLIHSLAYPRD